MMMRCNCQKLFSRFAWIFCLLVGLGPICAQVQGQTKHPQVNVLLLVRGKWDVDKTLARQLAEDNIHFVTARLADPLSPGMIRQFHSVIIADYEGSRVEYFLDQFVKEYQDIKQNLQVIQDYVHDGGSLFFTPYSASLLGAPAISQALEPYGLTVLPLQARDDQHYYTRSRDENTISDDEYCWTTQIADHPATRNVKQIVYPATMFRWDDMYSCPVIRMQDPAWTPLVTTMPTAVAARGKDYLNWTPIEKDPPVLAAVRDFGKGRVGFLTPSSYYTWQEPFSDPRRGWIRESHTGRIDGSFMDKGIPGHPSDGRQLLVGMLRYMAQPSRENQFGQYDQARLAQMDKPASVPVPSWLFKWDRKHGQKWF
ncbi:MAG: hypothetical protein ACF8OB_13755, partial [Phycisphaeraceae bacterium JB051]